MNERTRFFIKKSHNLFSKGWCFLCVWGVSWRRGQTATYWPKVPLTIAALLILAGLLNRRSLRAQSPLSAAGSHAGILSPTDSNWNWLTQAVCSTWLYNCLTFTCFLWAYTSVTITEFNHIHRSRWYSDIFDLMHLFRCSSAYLHRCISWLTARSRVNI